jgi:hypothetical protein
MGFCTPSYTQLPEATSIIEGTEIPEWVAAAGREIFNAAAGIAGSPYPDYTGERFASYGEDGQFTADERAGMDILRSGAENYLPYMNRASDIANTLGGGYDSMSRSDLMGDPYSGASRGYLEGDFQGLSSDELLGNYQGATREELLGNYQGATREELLGNYQGATREELLGDPFNLSSAQPYMDIYQSSMDPAVREIEKQTLQAQNQARATAARSGSFGGSRLGIIEGTAAGEGSRAAGDLRAGAAKEGLTLPLVVTTQIELPEPQLKTQCETASLKISKAALAQKMSCAVNSLKISKAALARKMLCAVNFWKIDKAVCLWKTHAGRRQRMIDQQGSERKTLCMAAMATNVPQGSVPRTHCALGSKQTKRLALHK